MPDFRAEFLLWMRAPKLNVARKDRETAWQRSDDEAAHSRSPRQVRGLRDRKIARKRSVHRPHQVLPAGSINDRERRSDSLSCGTTASGCSATTPELNLSPPKASPEKLTADPEARASKSSLLDVPCQFQDGACCCQ